MNSIFYPYFSWFDSPQRLKRRTQASVGATVSRCPAAAVAIRMVGARPAAVVSVRAGIVPRVCYPLVNSHSYGKSPFLMGKSTISMAIFNSYGKLPEGNLQ